MGPIGCRVRPQCSARPVLERLSAWFLDPGGRDRTYREIRRFDEVSIDLDEVADAVDDLLGDR